MDRLEKGTEEQLAISLGFPSFSSWASSESAAKSGSWAWPCWSAWWRALGQLSSTWPPAPSNNTPWEWWSATTPSLIPPARWPCRGCRRSAIRLYPWLLLVVPTVGGLLSGVLVFSLAPEAEGHGTDAVIDAYHHRQGQIRPRVPLVKIVASALDARHRRIGRPRRADRPDRGRLRLFAGQPAAPEGRRTPGADGGGHGGGHRRHLPRRWPAPCSPPRFSTVRRSSRPR